MLNVYKPTVSSHTFHGTAVSSITSHGPTVSSHTSHGTAMSSHTSHGTMVSSLTSHGTTVSSHTSHGTTVSSHTSHGTAMSSHTSYGTKAPSHTSNGTTVSFHTSHGTTVSSHTSHCTTVSSHTSHGTTVSSHTSHCTTVSSHTSHGTTVSSQTSHGTTVSSHTSHGTTETAEESGSATEGAAPCEEAKARAARAQASIKERERQVQRALATSLRDRDKEREYHKRDEAVQHFNALLADLVRNPDLTWREAKKQLKKDHRYSLAEELSKDDKERLFGQHIGVVSTKRRDKLRAVLSELGVGGAAAWRDVKERLRDHPAAPQYKNAPQMEREFRDYQRDKQSNAKTALRQLLQETRAITHRSLAAVKDAPHALTALHDTLKHDARYIALEHIPEEREAIITSYLEELDKKGPPPPPTATEPSRRAKQ